MSRNVEVIKSSETVQEAAKRLARENIGAMPIVDGERLTGMLTDRDIVVKVIAEGKTPSEVMASELQTGKPVYVQADASIDDAMQLMAQNKIRRLPVVEDGKLIGMLTQADVVKALPKERAGELIETISRD
jgi:CBS domain-containing protein